MYNNLSNRKLEAAEYLRTLSNTVHSVAASDILRFPACARKVGQKRVAQSSGQVELKLELILTVDVNMLSLS